MTTADSAIYRRCVRYDKNALRSEDATTIVASMDLCVQRHASLRV